MARHHFVERKTRYKMAIPKFATAINPARKKVNKPPPRHFTIYKHHPRHIPCYQNTLLPYHLKLC